MPLPQFKSLIQQLRQKDYKRVPSFVGDSLSAIPGHILDQLACQQFWWPPIGQGGAIPITLYPHLWDWRKEGRKEWMNELPEMEKDMERTLTWKEGMEEWMRKRKEGMNRMTRCCAWKSKWASRSRAMWSIAQPSQADSDGMSRW